jgi:hypothetical protein
MLCPFGPTTRDMRRRTELNQSGMARMRVARRNSNNDPVRIARPARLARTTRPASTTTERSVWRRSTFAALNSDAPVESARSNRDKAPLRLSEFNSLLQELQR